MSRTAVIVNPRAGGGKAARMWPEVERRLVSRLGAVSVHFTGAAGDGTELTQRLLGEGFNRILAAGGDGTVNEVANGFFAGGEPVRPEASLGLLPLGSGGDFRRTLGIPRRIEDAIDLLAAGNVTTIDVGRVVFLGHGGAVQNRLFVNIASFGLGGVAAAIAHRTKAPYALATLAAFRRRRMWTVRLALDSAAGPAPLRIADVAVGNGRFQAGGMEVCPCASLTDGLLDVTVIAPVSWIDLLRDGRLLYTGGLYRHAKVSHYRAARIAAEPDSAVPVELDGEPLGTLPAEFTVLPGRLRVVC